MITETLSCVFKTTCMIGFKWPNGQAQATHETDWLSPHSSSAKFTRIRLSRRIRLWTYNDHVPVFSRQANLTFMYQFV